MFRTRYPWFQYLVGVSSILYAMVFVAMLIHHPGSRKFYHAFMNTYQILPPLFSGVCGLVFARRSTHLNSSRRLGWLAIGLASLSFALGQITWTYYESIRGIEVPFPGWPDAGYLGTYPFLIAGVVLLSGGRELLARARLLLDSAIAAAGVGMMSWYFLIRLQWGKSDLSLVGKLISAAYPLGDIAALFVALILIGGATTDRDRRRSFILIASGMLMIAFADSTFTYYSLRNAYQTGMWSDWGWSFGWLLIGYASLTRLWWPSAPPQAEQEAAESARPAGSLHLLRVVAPYAAALAATVLVVCRDYNEPPYRQINIGTIISGLLLLLLIIARQVFTLMENQHLTTRLRSFNENLEHMVRRRTVQLAAMQQLTKAVSSCRRAHQVASAAVVHARPAITADAVALWILEADLVEGGSLPRLRAAEGLDAEPAIQEFIAQQTQVDQPRIQVLPHQLRENGKSAGVLLVAPLRCQQQPVGLIGAIRWEGGFEAEESELLESIGIEVGTALEMARQYDAAVEAADLDPVTALYNHRYVHQRLDLEMKSAAARDESLAVIMVDISNFKLFNDTYGHPMGDQVLKRVAHILKEEARKHDLPARYGGDEFLIVLPGSDSHDAMAMAQRLRERMLQEGFHRGGDARTIPVTLSFGIATFPRDSRNRHELLTLADANLYSAKNTEGGIRGTTEIQRNNRQLRSESSYAVLDGMVTAVDNKDRYTRRHSEDVTEYALWIAEELGLSEETMRVIRMGGLLHDVGKIGVPDEVLRKPGRLEANEWELMRRHPHLGALIVGGVPDMESIIDAVRHHHERWDGQGYPDGLAGEDIPLLGRILAVPDAFSAMTSDRPYRKGLSRDAALAEIRANSGTQFDPAMVRAFLSAAERRCPTHWSLGREEALAI